MTDKERAIIREFLPSILFVPRFGQKLGRYIAAQFVLRPVNAKTPQTLRLAGVPGAGNVTRTHDLLITNRIQCNNKGKMGLFSPFAAVESSGQHSFPERRHTHIFRCGSERGSAEGEDKISCTSYFLRRSKQRKASLKRQYSLTCSERQQIPAVVRPTVWS